MISEEIDTAISVIKYDFRQRVRLVNEIKRKLAPTKDELILMGRELTLIENVNKLISEIKKEAFATLGKLPPQDIELEESIIGALIIETGTISKVPFLKAEHFHSEVCKITFMVILKMHAEVQPIDMRTVVGELRKEGQLEIVGGAHFIASVTSRVASTANVGAHARLLIQLAIKRELIRMCGETLSDAYDDSADCFDMVDQVGKRLNVIQEWTKK